MASNINPDNIDGTYPIERINNDSQGFRTNFTNTSTNLQVAKDEIEDLQSKSILKSPLTGEGSTDNDMDGTELTAALLNDTREKVVALGTVSGATAIDHSAGQVHTLTTSGAITLSFANFPTTSYGRVKVEFDITNVAHTVTFPASVTGGVDFLEGWSANVVTFSEINVYVFEFTTYDGVTYTVSDFTRGGGGGAGVPAGGTTGQILVKQSATDGDADWQDQGAAAPSQTEYCPGYTFTYSTTEVFVITGINATGVFGQGRRLKFIDGGSTYYGIVLSAVYGTNTTISMSMEGGDVLTPTITEVCSVTSTTNWAPIVTDPFGGDKIWDIATGAIGGTQYWVAVGDGGKIFYSTDGGINWSAGTSGITYPIRCVAFDSNIEKFWVGGQNSANDFPWIAHSVNGASWVSVAMPTGITAWAVNDYIHEIQYNEAGAYFICSFFDNDGSNYDIFVTNDEFANGITRLTTASADALVAADESGLAANNNQYWTYSSASATVYYTGFTDTSGTAEKSGTALVTANSMLYIGEANVYGVIGQSDGKIEMGTMGSTEYDDDVTFSNAIRRFSHSLLLDRTVCVGDAATIGYIDDADMQTVNGGGIDAWTAVDNGFAPTANISSVAYNESDAVFVAVADNGQICRSTTGLGTAPTPSYSGWTAIAADPFTGGNIEHIATGVIGGTEWWVIAGSTLVFTSTDAGITWTSRSTSIGASITALSYDSTNETFVVGAANGNFAWTNDGTNWTLDNTSVAALGGFGSNRINSMVWDVTAGLWQFIVDFNVSTTGSMSCTGAFTTFTMRETSTLQNMGYRNTSAYQPGIASRAIWSGGVTIGQYWSGATDIQPSGHANMVETVTAVFGKTGTLGDAADIFFGDANGDIELWAVSERTDSTGAMTGQVNGFAFSTAANRMIAVGQAGEIKTQAGLDLESRGTWYDVATPFSGNINAVAYNATDDIFICVCADGVIARSTDGIS